MLNSINNKQYYTNLKTYANKIFKTCTNLRIYNYKKSKIYLNFKIF